VLNGTEGEGALDRRSRLDLSLYDKLDLYVLASCKLDPTGIFAFEKKVSKLGSLCRKVQILRLHLENCLGSWI